MGADERPDLVKNGKFTLVKADKNKGVGEGDVPAAYNPYMHTSSSMMNDQFTGAYARGNFPNSKDAAKVRVIELAEKQMKQWKKLRDKSSDTESINFANQNIDRIMMEAVDDLDKLN